MLRDGATAYLELVTRLTGCSQRMAPLLRRFLGEQRHIVDLCSGGGGPLYTVLQSVPEVTATMTDRFPNLNAFEAVRQRSGGRIDYWRHSVDARQVPSELRGFTTLFNAFHHFRPGDARAILANAVERGQPIAVFEIVNRSPLTFLAVMLLPLLTLFTMPLVRAPRASWLFFTYVLPLIPALLLWDGLVSCLRVYSPAELRELVGGLDAFEWEIGTYPLPPRCGTFLVGRPKGSVEHQQP